MFARCPEPIWRRDDFTACFQRDVLQTLFPLLACGASLAWLVIQAYQKVRSRRRTAGYKSIPDESSYFPRLSQQDRDEDDSDQEEDEEDEDEEQGRQEEEEIATPGGTPGRYISLRKTITRANGAVVEVSRPKGEVAIVVVEELAVVGEVLIHLAAFMTRAWGPHGHTAAIAGLVTWLYVLALASMRLLFSSSSRYSFSKLWNHTTSIYGLQWLFTVMIFRSAIIHPRAGSAQALTILDFLLTTALTLIAFTARKGNKAVVIEFEDDLEPSKEPVASLFSIATFGWVDSIVWKGYKRTFEIADVWNLIPMDKAAAVLQDFRQARKTSRLIWHLLRYFRGMLLVQAIWACFSSVFIFVPTLLLKAILEYVEHPEDTPPNAAWLYVVLLFVTGCVQAIGDAQALWIGRRICIRLRAAIIGEIYGKALRRKATSGSDTVLGARDEQKKSDGFPAKVKKMISFGRKKRTEAKHDDALQGDEVPDSQVNTGTIINLMAVDSFKVGEASAYLHFIWAGMPVQIIIAITLLYRILGYSSIAGLVMIFLLLPVNVLIARQFNRFQKRIMGATDERIHTTNEVLQNIRIIKYFAWETRFNGVVNEKRVQELKHLRHRYTLWAFAATLWYGVPILITFTSFLVYTKFEKKDLVPSVAFTSLSLFNILRTPLDQFADMLAHVQESKVSVDRVEEFLNEEETEKYTHLRHDNDDDDGQPLIQFDTVNCSWGGRSEALRDGSTAFRLINLDVQFRVGQLNVIVGPTGSGKSSLLMALLGEMTLLSGTIYSPGGRSREDLTPDPETGLTESIAYCAQQAWLVNDTIKQNILFASTWDENRYRHVITACALERDLEILDAGDETMVGEKGITLSGGQKQRISLARALYSKCGHVFLDDCLSAVDSHTAKWIFDYCVMGPLMFNRTCILVTHNVALCVPRAHLVVVLERGKITSQGSPEAVMASGALGEDLQRSHPASTGTSRFPSRTASEVSSGDTMIDAGAMPVNGANTGKPRADNEEEQQAAGTTLTEGKTEGRVKWMVIKLYLSSMGRWYFWVAALIIFVAQQLGSLASNIWIRQWANAYHAKQVDTQHAQLHLRDFQPPSAQYGHAHSTWSQVSCLRSGTCAWKLPFVSTMASGVSPNASSSSDVDVNYYLFVYAMIGIVYLSISFTREALLFGGSLVASWKIHDRLLKAVTRAKFRFFDQTPLGQLMNRFSKDIEAVDQELSPAAIGLVHCLASVIMVTILISIITPGFLIAGLFISAIYFFIGKIYVRSSRDLKRLESVQRSPLYQQFGETLSGIITIRAYGDERRFIRDNLHRVNTHNRPHLYLWATNRWLAFRVDVTGALVSFFAGAFVISSVGRIDAGAAGLSMTYAVTFTENVLWLVRLYSVNEQNMNSIERIKEYLEVDQEAPAIIPGSRPAANWPSQGSVQFINYSTRYRPDLDVVLRNVSFKIRPLEKVGIVGRTGAGKSSLSLALFRGLEAEEGKILIDDVDIGLIGLQDLRESVTTVPQDPTLFTGTIRTNLDPFTLFTDEEIFATLSRVHLIDSPDPSTQTESSASDPSESANQNPFLNLSSPVSESGNNLSQGQKQLLCLARAMLKSPKVLLMDEATASIDYATDAKIQESIRELHCTTITVAHRLQTIIDYDKVLVLDKGEVKEYEHPWELMDPERLDGPSIFRGMCEMSGDLEVLEEAAKKAWDTKRPDT
ncbi:MAG: hypothetical protein M1837_006327 [Sclerophora amabilis]|nr:MAG: hypothetical protein M1837_006327 [Sclerophora amabilis]